MSAERTPWQFTLLFVGWLVCMLTSGIALVMAWCTWSDNTDLRKTNTLLCHELHDTRLKLLRAEKMLVHAVMPMRMPHRTHLSSIIPSACAAAAATGEMRHPLCDEFRQYSPEHTAKPEPNVPLQNHPPVATESGKTSIPPQTSDASNPVPLQEQRFLPKTTAPHPSDMPKTAVPKNRLGAASILPPRKWTACSMTARDGGINFRLKTVAPLSFEGFGITTPDRYVLKFKGTYCITPVLKDNPLVHGIRVGIQPNGDTHVVFDLARPATAQVLQRTANEILLVLR